MSKTEILSALKKLTAAERDEVCARLAELDNETADSLAHIRSEELVRGAVQPKQHVEVFRDTRAVIS
jgi:acyl-CoA reductase-like NAD-dependent aldehyde dehydrogenase